MIYITDDKNMHSKETIDVDSLLVDIRLWEENLWNMQRAFFLQQTQYTKES